MESLRSNAVLFQAIASLRSCMKEIGFYGYRWIPRKSLSPSDLLHPVFATIAALLQMSLSPSAPFCELSFTSVAFLALAKVQGSYREVQGWIFLPLSDSLSMKEID